MSEKRNMCVPGPTPEGGFAYVCSADGNYSECSYSKVNKHGRCLGLRSIYCEVTLAQLRALNVLESKIILEFRRIRNDRESGE